MSKRKNVLSSDLPDKLMLNAPPIGLFWKDRDLPILGCNQQFATIPE
jgi:hypothetical protein